MEGVREHEFVFMIDEDHPGLDGHFPGHPVVPAVVLLDQLLTETARIWGRQPRRLVQVKFVTPLYPGQLAHASLVVDTPRLKFVVRNGERLLFSGEFLFS
jgi:3-hydroxymyristoyl/3-hydroxydecanoyl-(acyl carrier protein) dehydratase